MPPPSKPSAAPACAHPTFVVTGWSKASSLRRCSSCGSDFKVTLTSAEIAAEQAASSAAAQPPAVDPESKRRTPKPAPAPKPTTPNSAPAAAKV